jgi:hypothetical protein
MPVNGNVPVVRSVLPAGDAGVDATVRKMADLAFGKYGAKSAKIRALAIDIIERARVEAKDYYGMIVAIHNWVRDTIRYVRDPIGQETLSYPEETAFNSRAGDCDDLSILEIALLGSLGINSYPVVIGTTPGQFSHVYLHALVPAGRHRMAGQTVPLDPIMREWPAGKEAPAERVKRKKTYPQYQNGVNGMSGEMMPGMGAYAVGPSYLDTENAQASYLLSEGQGGGTKQVNASPGSTIRPGDKTLATTTSVVLGMGLGSDAMFGDGAKVRRPHPGEPGAFVTSREDRFGRIWNNAPGIRPAVNTGSLGPITGRRERSMTESLTSERSRQIPTTSGVMAAESRGIQRKIVTVGGRDHTKPTAKTVTQQAREVQGLAGLVRHMANLHRSCRTCSGMAGLGYAWDGAPTVSPAVAEVASLSWWARFKADLLQAQSEVLDRYAPNAESKAVKAVAKEAEKVAKEAEKVEASVIATPADQQAALEIKGKLSEQQKVNGLGFMFDGMDADETTKVVGLWDNIRTWFADRKAWKSSAPEGKRPAFSLWRKDHGLMYQGAARPATAAPAQASIDAGTPAVATASDRPKIRKKLYLDNPAYFEGAYDDLSADFYPLTMRFVPAQGLMFSVIKGANGRDTNISPKPAEYSDLMQEYVDKMNAAARKYKHGISGLPGMGGLTDTLKSPIVLVGLAAAAGFFLLRKKGK